jgi:hypothetical protein
MVPKEEILKRKAFVSDRISTQVRTLSIGTLAFSWGLLIADSKTAESIADHLRVPLMLVAALSILALLFDFLQYSAAYANVDGLIQKMERLKEQQSEYDNKVFTYKVQTILFSAKQAAMTFACIVLVTAVGCDLVWR